MTRWLIRGALSTDLTCNTVTCQATHNTAEFTFGKWETVIQYGLRTLYCQYNKHRIRNNSVIILSLLLMVDGNSKQLLVGFSWFQSKKYYITFREVQTISPIINRFGFLHLVHIKRPLYNGRFLSISQNVFSQSSVKHLKYKCGFLTLYIILNLFIHVTHNMFYFFILTEECGFYGGLVLGKAQIIRCSPFPSSCEISIFLIGN